MAVRLVFESTDSESEMQCYLNHKNEIYVQIDNNDMPPSFITLDKQDSIKLVKVLKTEINNMGVSV
jgi:hypothetical protein